jgi:hypothetical protein
MRTTTLKVIPPATIQLGDIVFRRQWRPGPGDYVYRRILKNIDIQIVWSAGAYEAEVWAPAMNVNSHSTGRVKNFRLLVARIKQKLITAKKNEAKHNKREARSLFRDLDALEAEHQTFVTVTKQFGV